MKNLEATAKTLADMYTDDFGGKPSGRYRISRKLICDTAGQRRLYQEDITSLTRRLLEHGFILIDLETFFVVMSANAFVNYRRAAKEAGRSKLQ